MDIEQTKIEPNLGFAETAPALPLKESLDSSGNQLTLDDADGDFGDFQTFADSPEESSCSSQVPNVDSPTSTTTYSTTTPSSSSSTAPNSAATSSVSSPAHHFSQQQSSASLSAKYPNIYEMDMFAFQEFVTNFEEQLVHLFVPFDGKSSLTDKMVPQNTPSDELFAFSNGNRQQSFANADPTTMNLLPKNSPSSPIHSQEDIINDCPIWYNLTGSYNCKPPLQFLKSTTFKRFIHSLEPINKEISAIAKPKRKLIKARNATRSRHVYADPPANMKNQLTLISSKELADLNDSLQIGSPRNGSVGDSEEDATEQSYDENDDNDDNDNDCNNYGLVDEEELASDLDMHSLIVGQNHSTTVSVQSSGNANGSTRQHNATCKDVMEVSADEIIEEIETMMDDRAGGGTTVGKTKRKISPQITTGAVSSSSSTGTFEYQPVAPTADPMLSLNAASLLDAAIQSWQNAQNFGDGDGDTPEGMYHSLPANLNPPSDDHQASKPSPLTYASHNRKDPTQSSTAELSKLSSATSEAPPSIVSKLNRLTIAQLNELYMELEQIIQLRSEVLITELALRDELEYEKEMKNQFISLLLSVQNKRRYYTGNGAGKGLSVRSARFKQQQTAAGNNNRLVRRNSTHSESISSSSSSSTSRLMSRARMLDLSSFGSSLRESFRFSGTGGSGGSFGGGSGPSHPVYLTTVIPYRNGMTVDTATLQMLIKLLMAMDEDSSTVPSLLTDYILKVICP